MRRSIMFFFGIMLLAWPLTASAGILEIQLANGNVIRTNQVWEEDNTIFFYSAEGKVGITKNQVAQIREVVAMEDFAGLEEVKGLKNLSEICKEGEIEAPDVVIWTPLYQWVPPAEMSVVENDQGTVISINGRLLSAQKEKTAERLVFQYRDRLKEVIDVKTISPIFKGKDDQGVNEFTVTDSVSATLCPRDVEVSVIRFQP